MMQYLVILLDDTSVSYCHYNNDGKVRRLIPLETLKAGIIYAMKENLNIQFVHPDYVLPKEYATIMDSIDHICIKPVGQSDGADVIVLDGMEQIKGLACKTGVSYVLKVDKESLFVHSGDMFPLLGKVDRLNVVITDIATFTDSDFEQYSEVLLMLSEKVKDLYLSGKAVQLNLLTDRMMLDGMNNCGAGDSTLTLAPDGKFYICPAFYHTNEEDRLGKLSYSIGDLQHGLNIQNPQLYKIAHAPLCRHCDAYQCKRCIWLNRKTTFEVNTPSHEQCVVAHLERNASRQLLNDIRKYGSFLLERDEIKDIAYLDPFYVRKEWTDSPI